MIGFYQGGGGTACRLWIQISQVDQIIGVSEILRVPRELGRRACLCIGGAPCMLVYYMNWGCAVHACVVGVRLACL